MADLVWAVLKEPGVQIVLICIAGLVPLTLGTLIWISSMHFIVQMILGIVTGLGLMTSHHFMEVQRSYARRHEAVKLAQLSRLDENDLRRLLPDTNFASWALSCQDFEKLRWINAELDQIWPFLKEALSIHVKLKLQSVLHRYKLDSMQRVHIKEIILGRHGPYLSGIKVVEGGKDEIILEAAVDWRHNEDHHMILQLQANDQDFIIKVMDFMLLGTLKLHFKSLKEQLPGFGAIALSLGEALIVDLRTKILEGDARSVQGIEKQVQNIIWTSLMDLLIWPSYLVIPLNPGEYSCYENKPVGYLKVELLEARELALKEVSGSSDPVLLFYVQRKHNRIKRTYAKCSMSDPMWNDSFVLDVEDPKNQKLTIRLIESDAPNMADYVGNVELQINELNSDTTLDLWVDLHGNPSKLKCQGSLGKLHLKLEYKDLSVSQLPEETSEGSSVNAEADDGSKRLNLETEEKQERVRVTHSERWNKDNENDRSFHQTDGQECYTSSPEIEPGSGENSLEVDESVFKFADIEVSSKMSDNTDHDNLNEQPVLLNKDNYGPELFEVD